MEDDSSGIGVVSAVRLARSGTPTRGCELAASVTGRKVGLGGTCINEGINRVSSGTSDLKCTCAWI